ncbi:MAG: Na(+)-translocating NADH-quinone reductase subunit A [Octadecabacter sp.]|nr:Na(+)-translocating NADH-quinone reductase subunit A [Octadecabacter sp.]
MTAHRFAAGLTLTFPSPAVDGLTPARVITQEAGIRPSTGQTLRVTPLVKEGDLVAQGAPVACLRDAPNVQFVAPMAARVARITLEAGRKISEIVLFREDGGDVRRHDVAKAANAANLRSLMQGAGVWPWLQRRPFGGMPATEERPAAIVVMAVDTRPFAPDPRPALEGREDAFARGLKALALLSEGPVLLCQPAGAALMDASAFGQDLRRVDCGTRHPQGAAGIQIHSHAPATLDAPVWDIHAEDVAALGDLLQTGVLPMTRLVQIAGAGLREARLVRTQQGADLRELTQHEALPGPQRLLSGSPIDGQDAHWLAPRHRQITVLPTPAPQKPLHWFAAALTRSGTPMPVIPTAALSQAFGAALPAVPFIRALTAGDDEMAMKLGLLSLLEEDIGLADYVVGGDAHLANMLRGMLDRIRTEMAA